MLRSVMLLFLLCAACSPAPLPDSKKAVAAFEVPLPTAADKAEFLDLLRQQASAHGYHVDATTDEQLRQLSEVSPTTMNAAVWRGDDEELVASAMDFRDNIGRIWIVFLKGEDPVRFEQFRETLMPQVRKRWANTASLPITPNGAIPLPRDLEMGPSGYMLKHSAQSRYLKSDR